MKAVMPMLLPDVMAFRKRTGADRFDEVWEGVLHMVPAPTPGHQDLAGDLQTFLLLRWARPHGAKVYHEVNLASVGGWPNDYRIPDLLLLTKERRHIRRAAHFEGAPDLVVEFHSPGDETYEKLPWYAALGVPEVWVIHRDTKEPELYLLRKGGYRKQRARANGWLRSPGTGIELCSTPPSKLAIRLQDDDATREELPMD